jgi:hypothetical protein
LIDRKQDSMADDQTAQAGQTSDLFISTEAK